MLKRDRYQLKSPVQWMNIVFPLDRSSISVDTRICGVMTITIYVLPIKTGLWLTLDA
jgi:hypothetical protein